MFFQGVFASPAPPLITGQVMIKFVAKTSIKELLLPDVPEQSVKNSQFNLF